MNLQKLNQSKNQSDFPKFLSEKLFRSLTV